MMVGVKKCTKEQMKRQKGVNSPTRTDRLKKNQHIINVKHKRTLPKLNKKRTEGETLVKSFIMHFYNMLILLVMFELILNQ